MAKIVGENEWNKIGSSNGSPYFVLKEESGMVVITIKGPHVYVVMGDKDSLGRQWQKNWTKNEVLVNVDGDKLEAEEKGEKVLLLGGDKSPLKRFFIDAWKDAGLKPTTIEGSVWEVTRTDTYEYDIKNITQQADDAPEDKQDDVPTEAETPLKENKETPKKVKEKSATEKIQQIIDITQELRNEPELQEGMETADFIAAVGLRVEVSMEDIEKNLKTHERKKIIFVKDGTVVAV